MTYDTEANNARLKGSRSTSVLRLALYGTEIV